MTKSKIQKGFTKMQSKDTNSIELIPTKVPFIKSVKLETGFNPKFLGHYNQREKLFLCKRSYSQIHHKSNSIAFNYDFINEFDICMIPVELNAEFLFTRKEHLLKVGEIFQFKNYELQIFEPIIEFSKSISEAKAKNNIQLNFFS